MYTNEKLEIIQNNKQYISADGTQYPRNYPKDKIEELFLVTEVSRPEDPTLIVEGFIIDETYTQVWQTVSKSVEELQAEADAILNSARELALSEVWADPFDLLDDILNRGLDVVKIDRDAIKAAHPKPIKGE